MTKNQLDFQRNYETRRHNLELEKEQEFQNLSGRLSAQASLASAAASSKQAEASLKQAETSRYSAETSRIQAQEAARHNLAQEEQSMIGNIFRGVGELTGGLKTIAQVAKTFG